MGSFTLHHKISRQYILDFFERVKDLARFIRDSLNSILYYGHGRWCPVCEKNFRKFKSFGHDQRKDVKCPFCSALERHRLVWLYFKKRTDLFSDSSKKMLHIAPERCFRNRLKNHLKENYITADLADPHASIKMDITDIKYPDKYFDVIYCSHVLEHVQDDRKAMRELNRVLKPDGWAILIVPVEAEKTFEDPSVVEPSERLRIFGQEDHVRIYGLDYIDRLKESGFQVKISTAADLPGKNDLILMGLTSENEKIYYCTKS